MQATVAMPASFAELAGMVNSHLGSDQHSHHVTDAQVLQMEAWVGDVGLLTDLAGLGGSSLNKVLKFDVCLNAMQIVAIRGLLHRLQE